MQSLFDKKRRFFYKVSPDGATKIKIKLSYIFIFVECVHSSVPMGVKLISQFSTKKCFSFVGTNCKNKKIDSVMTCSTTCFQSLCIDVNSMVSHDYQYFIDILGQCLQSAILFAAGGMQDEHCYNSQSPLLME